MLVRNNTNHSAGTKVGVKVHLVDMFIKGVHNSPMRRVLTCSGSVRHDRQRCCPLRVFFLS